MCVVVGPDSTAQCAIENLLWDAGVSDVRPFSSGKDACDRLRANPAPGLITQEWRLPALKGLLLRILQEGALAQVSIVVVSSLIRKKEIGLV